MIPNKSLNQYKYITPKMSQQLSKLVKDKIDDYNYAAYNEKVNAELDELHDLMLNICRDTDDKESQNMQTIIVKCNDYDMIDGKKKYCKSYTCFYPQHVTIRGKKLYICDHCDWDDKNYRCEDHIKGKLYQAKDDREVIYCMDCIKKRRGVYNEKEWTRMGKEENF